MDGKVFREFGYLKLGFYRENKRKEREYEFRRKH